MSQPTPVMRQWQQLKARYPDVLLLFRLGDFYELFGEDARIVARECHLTLTTRERAKGDAAMPMCGVPYHAAERYLSQLLAQGFRCAVCEQMQDPATTKGLVHREVVRVLTPGTLTEDALLESVGSVATQNYLAAICSVDKGTGFGLALVDASTGEFLAGQITSATDAPAGTSHSAGLAPGPSLPLEVPVATDSSDQTPAAAETDPLWTLLREVLLRYQPAELVLPEKIRAQAGLMAFLKQLPCSLSPFDGSAFDQPYDLLCRHFDAASLRGFGLEEAPAAQEAAALALQYLQHTQLGSLAHLRQLRLLNPGDRMVLDYATRRNLELEVSVQGSAKGTLLEVLDHCQTRGGLRLLRAWIREPLLNREAIETRQAAVADLVERGLARQDSSQLLAATGDLLRLVTRTMASQATPRDLAALRATLQALPALRAQTAGLSSPALQRLTTELTEPPGITDLLACALADDPPPALNEGGVIRTGYSEALDHLRTASKSGKQWMVEFEDEERRKTTIKSLKVGYNSVFGYYIEVTRPHLALVPEHYIRRQTTSTAERYVTQDLKEREKQVLEAESQSIVLERQIFQQLQEQVAAQAACLRVIGHALAELDALVSLAESAVRHHYTRPVIKDEPVLDIRSGRHAVVENSAREPFVPNDCVMDTDSQQVLIITGPNASGKSTYLRQVALIVLLAHIGSFVPARQATIGLVDRIFTRVGAQDDLATGQSTFTVEMNETANILNNATPRSLVILDEVGRGTSTYDGLSIAWAVAEYLHHQGCKTLFATHYHHLNELESQLPRVRNYRIAVKEEGDRIVFLRRIIRGGTDRSFGIQVARLAGLPEAVIVRANELLREFSARSEVRPVTPVPLKKIAGTLFAPTPEPGQLEACLQEIDAETISPEEAVLLLRKLKSCAEKYDVAGGSQ